MTYTLTDNNGSAFGLGTVISEDSAKDSNLFQTPIPLSDSTDAIMLDLFGASRTINIKGVYTSNDGNVQTFVQNLDKLLNGAQNTKIYHSDKSNYLGPTGTEGGYVVLIQSVKWTSEEGGVNKVEYEIEMTEGSF